MKFPFLYLLIVNAAALLFMLLDKHNARKKRQRIPEAILWGFCLTGGSLGSFLGMFLGHHKTKKPIFLIGIPAVLIVHIFAVMLYYK